ncbi:stage III sporulation protein AF [Thermoanaerobacterium thermosaccharolyticum]|uniref:stage III sporulation protein AF n=1 Tax=Thermoanaerobacterium TaxID=28895 RepID=UPI0026DEABB9|nr:stage III sporulation protein AF [Thermoanaerobacterium sp. CMT5567-10]WHE08032.1 stage III sporulation protein AF [Thermoanaerobacterium thermosaccharolyticum]WKV08989.1 stage III sporulation protein AF [Thermoanaerobacterium sp. CMT5567-10]
MHDVEMVKNWILQIAYISILAIVFELLIPSSNMKKYVKVVIGLTIMIAIINPILGFLKNGVDINSTLEKEYNYNNIDINSMTKQAEVERNKLIVAEYKKRLNEQIKEKVLDVIDASDVEIESSINEDLNDKNFGAIKNIHVVLSNVKYKMVNDINDGKIIIDTSKFDEKEQILDDIKNDISKFYNVPLKNITIEER